MTEGIHNFYVTNYNLYFHLLEEKPSCGDAGRGKISPHPETCLFSAPPIGFSWAQSVALSSYLKCVLLLYRKRIFS